jgi:phosphoribosyl 1,2-cyclic phosphodiesterase
VIRFCSLGSGSSGNATVVEASGGITTTRLLIDAGFSLRELEARLARAGLAPGDLDAIFVTHEHSDHIGCAVAFAERHRLALWMSRGTWRAIGETSTPARLGFVRDGEVVVLGDLELRPFTVAHDAAEPLQLRCSDGNACLGVLTDLGSLTEHMLEAIRGCEALVLECNHDEAMLAGSRYPPSLKARIGGRYGHLSNTAAVELLATGVGARLRHLVGADLSRENNRPEIVRAALAACWGSRPEDVVIADPALGCAWLQLG